MINEEYVRVRENLNCPICHHDSWCLIHYTGRWCLCPRTPSKVFVPRYSAYKHDLQDFQLKEGMLKEAKANRVVPINWKQLTDIYTYRIEGVHILAQSWGVNESSLYQLHVGWDSEAFTFPMFNSDREVIGMHRRFPDGTKRCIRGSRLGLFIPAKYQSHDTTYITEGLSDTVTAVDLGLNVVGRANCETGAHYLKHLVKCDKVVIIADNDAPGFRGAMRLTKHLSQPNISLIMPNEKDLRDQVRIWGKSRCLTWINGEVNGKEETKERGIRSCT